MRGRRPPGPLAVLALALAAAAWLLFAPEGGAPDADRPEAVLPSAGTPAPALATVARDQPALPSASRSRPAADHGDAPPPPPGAPREVRVTDRAGRPIPGAVVHLDVDGARGPLTHTAVTGVDGRVGMGWGADRLVRVRLRLRGMTQTHEAVLLHDEAGIDPQALASLRAESLAWLPVRTVDERGEARPAQRVLFRPREEGWEPTGWWGKTSDAEGLCLLGPFRHGQVVEVRAGPRGVPAAAIASGGAWARFRVDGAEVHVVVGSRPRLSLAFPGLEPGLGLRIAVLDAQTGRYAYPPSQHASGAGPWTAEALAEDLVPEVFVGPLPDGRWARLVDPVIGEEPIEVRFESGSFLRGRVAGPLVAGDLHGKVRAFGRGFEAEAWVAADGGFVLGGMPDEPVTLLAGPLEAPDLERPLGGVLRRETERDVLLPVAPLATVSGRVLDAAGREIPSTSVQATREDLPPEALPSALVSGGRFALRLPPGRWTIVLPGAYGRPLAAVDLGEVEGDREGVVLRLPER